MLPCGSDTLASFLLPTSSSSVLQGSKSVLDYDNGDGDESFLQSPDKEESVGEGCCEDSCSRPAKKKRLSSNQVESLERNFAVENRLEPERKLKLAKELGLQPRQVAIWFQNRRARFKNKQLEEDYDLLKASYNKLKVDYDSLYKENEVLRGEVLALKQLLLAEEKAEGRLELDLFDAVHSSNAEPKSSITDLDPFNASIELTRKSDVLDSDSPNGNRCFFIEHADSTHVIEPDQADFSKDEADNWNKTLLQLPAFPNLELEYYHDHPPAGCSSFGFTVEDQKLWSSLY